MSCFCHAFYVKIKATLMKLHVIYDYKNIFPELSGKALTDAMIRRCLGKENIEICRTEKGKPYLLSEDGSHGQTFISVSHSNAVFALLEAGCEVGLDIQHARDVSVVKIASRYFTEDEAKSIAEDPAGDQFFLLWTRKEAYNKYTGAGMEQIMKKEPLPDDVRFTDLRLEDGCFCAICAGREEGEQTDEIHISYGE